MAAASATFTEGRAPYIIAGETYETYYKLFGSLTNTTHRPLIALHGGPGMSHDYMLPISDLSLPGPHSRPVLFYDQIGNARSTHLKDKPKEFFTVDLFVNELSNILSHFKISEYDLIGHSWGGMLATEFEVRLQPTGLKSLILTDTLSETKLWGQSTMQLLADFPDDVKQGMAAGFGDPVKYRAALEKFHAVHGCTVKPMPKEITFSVLDQIFGDKETGKGGDPTVSLNMFGGAISGWSIIDKLHLVRVPAFVINGRKDIAQDFVCEAYFWKIKKAKWVTMEGSSHVPMWEEREKYMNLLGEWLDSIE